MSSSSGKGRGAAELEAPGGRGKDGLGAGEEADGGAGYRTAFGLSAGVGLCGLKMRRGPTVGLSPPSPEEAGRWLGSMASELPNVVGSGPLAQVRGQLPMCPLVRRLVSDARGGRVQGGPGP